ncbi:MAG: formylglycine-generating enzyme family protein [Opitutaceae bacterium]|nr:formylglycine-generating enzyme family protein [Opitutaceae bacterium]
MKSILMKRLSLLLTTALMQWGVVGTAFGIEAQTVAVGVLSGDLTMAMVRVRDIENTGQSEKDWHGTTGTYGAVSYEYAIGTYEVTNAQYIAFLNAVVGTGIDQYNLYASPDQYSAESAAPVYNAYYGITRNASGVFELKAPEWANKPVNYVSFYDAARFTNWLTNGATAGADTENGLYAFSGVTTLVSVTPPDHLTSTGWALPGENEWYKAAYYDPAKGETGGYWLYPNRNDNFTTQEANYNSVNYSASDIMETGTYDLVTSAYGTRDQGGSLWEWTDTIHSAGSRVFRGGSFSGEANAFASTARNGTAQGTESYQVGFRVVYLGSLTSVPESAGTAGVIGTMLLVICLWIRIGGQRTC